jgi:hypothetical protein
MTALKRNENLLILASGETLNQVTKSQISLITVALAIES